MITQRNFVAKPNVPSGSRISLFVGHPLSLARGTKSFSSRLNVLLTFHSWCCDFKWKHQRLERLGCPLFTLYFILFRIFIATFLDGFRQITLKYNIMLFKLQIIVLIAWSEHGRILRKTCRPHLRSFYNSPENCCNPPPPSLDRLKFSRKVWCVFSIFIILLLYTGCSAQTNRGTEASCRALTASSCIYTKVISM